MDNWKNGHWDSPENKKALDRLIKERWDNIKRAIRKLEGLKFDRKRLRK